MRNIEWFFYIDPLSFSVSDSYPTYWVKAKASQKEIQIIIILLRVCISWWRGGSNVTKCVNRGTVNSVFILSEKLI